MRALLLGAALLVAGCYETPEPDCAFQCGDGDDCPDDYGCATDGWCKRIDLPDDHVCEAEAAALEPLESPIAVPAAPPAIAPAH